MIDNFSNTPSKSRADLYLLGITMIWGSSFIAVKIALSFTTPFLFLALRFLIASLILLIIFRKKLMKFDAVTIKAGVVLGILLGTGFGAQTYGLVFTTASRSAFITGLFVILVPIFSMIFEKIIPRKLLWLGVMFSLTGLYFLTSPEGTSFNVGDGFTLIAAVAFGAHTVATQIYTKRYDFIQLTFLQILITGIGGLLSTLIIETPKFEANPQLILIILGTAIFPTVLNFYILNKYQRHTSSTRAAIIYSFEPVTAAVIAYLFLNEVLGVRGAIGGTLIIVGMLVAELKKRK